MKINEKNLSLFANSKGSDKEGYLLKRGEVNKNFQKRWFVLKGNLLFYFAQKYDRDPLGMIILEGCRIEPAEEEIEKYCFQIIFHGNRTYIVSADTQVAMEMWMKSLSTAGYDYMKMMITELQRQLNELDNGNSESKSTDAEIVRPPRRNPFNKGATSTPSSSIDYSSTKAALNDLINFGPPLPPPILDHFALKENDISFPNKFTDELNLMPNEDKDFSFLKLHDILGKPILELNNERRMIKLRGEQPLILL
ncbi:unnamed protein product [Diamesa serratosioi]